MSRDIIKQGDWGYGDLDGLAKSVDGAYKKWLKKKGLESNAPKTQKNRILYGKGAEKKHG